MCLQDKDLCTLGHDAAHPITLQCLQRHTFGETDIKCWPFQYLMSPMLWSVVMMSSGLIADINLPRARSVTCAPAP